MMTFTMINVEFNTKITTFQDTLQNFERRMTKMRTIISSMALQVVTPDTVSPQHVRKILRQIKEKLVLQPRLQLMGHPDIDVWSFYRHVKMVPLVLQDHLVVTFQIPLVDKENQLDLYKIQNLPVLHPALGIRFHYKVDSHYIAFHHNHSYYMTPDDLEVAACMKTKGAWCKFTSPMYSTVHSPSCISSVFLKKAEQIKELCEVETSLQKTPYAVH